LRYLKNKKYSREIVVADDGSKDKTSQIVKKFSDRGVRLVRLRKNKGKGGALREGVLNARGEYIIFMDADLSVPLENLDIFLKKLEAGNDIVIASRRIKGAVIQVHQPFIREAMGRVFTLLTRFLTSVYEVVDFTCGFKGFSNIAAKKIFINSQINRWAYDAEIIFLAKKYGFSINQSPITWKNREDSRVKLKSIVFETFRDLLKIRINDLQGKYENN
jgi:dolichyl-phosphate beta-glucosyltransferase